MNCTTIQTISNATPVRPGLLERVLAAVAAPAVRGLPPAALRDIALTDEQREEQEVREAWHRFMRSDVLRGL